MAKQNSIWKLKIRRHCSQLHKLRHQSKLKQIIESQMKIHVQVFPLPTVQFDKTVLWKVTRKIDSQFILINFSFCRFCLCTDREFVELQNFSVCVFVQLEIQYFRYKWKEKIFSFIFDYPPERYFIDCNSRREIKINSILDYKKQQQNQSISPVKLKRRLTTFSLSFINLSGKRPKKSFEFFTVNKDNLCNLVRDE